ncbi:SRP-less Sec system protein [Leptospira sp. GIMC2001]|uniref:SRP-less Sec system protein n=1 Tax=Leptospira sp. GIMC2001 TaxID=1513297 RepID=UPI00234AAA29|nr:SRP-less Sec system protein [Leptospira sp. GIMC2001]WCL48391.1 SRP-less Sec system protein [Leptospira sp. GIMC2001]
MSRLLNSSSIILPLLFISLSVFAQESVDNLDFLDKVENIQVPVEKAPTKVEPTSKTEPTKTSTKSTQKTQTKSTTKTATKKTTVTPTTTKKATTVAPTTSLTSPSSTTSKSTTTSPDPKLSTKSSEIEPQEEAGLDEGIWVDEPLAMEPDYLPGFAANVTPESLPVDEGKEKSADAQVVHPLPTVTGDYSIFKSFTGFLSKYQKAFYIFGILLIFAIYRLRSGRVSSSSRRSTPTIRRMRR